MKTTRALLASILLSLGNEALACTLYEGSFGGRILGRVDNGRVYEGAYSFNLLGRFQGNILYEGHSSLRVYGRKVGHILYEGSFSLRKLGEFHGCSDSDF